MHSHQHCCLMMMHRCCHAICGCRPVAGAAILASQPETVFAPTTLPVIRAAAAGRKRSWRRSSTRDQAFGQGGVNIHYLEKKLGLRH